MTIGPFLLGAPLALIGLIALPIIWFILRATPPAPKLAALPSLRLLDEIEPSEETPDRTPWWIWLLRLLAAAAIIFGLAQPVYAPGAKSADTEAAGPVLVVLDDGWASAPRWSDLRNAAIGGSTFAAKDTAFHLLLTAPRALDQDPTERLSQADFEARVRSLEPRPWSLDRAEAWDRLAGSGLQPGRILWVTDGLETEPSLEFSQQLSDLAPLTIFSAPLRGPVTVSKLNADSGGASVELYRSDTQGTSSHFVSALTTNGTAFATAEAVFTPGDAAATARFDLPPAALSRISRFQVTGAASSGLVWLWDSSNRSRRVGLVSGDATAQPLLSDMHYVRRALQPFADIQEDTLQTLIEADPDAIILTDIGQIEPAVRTLLDDWLNEGGALIRFAGPRMATQDDDLVPTPLRQASREIGGALTWEDPQPLGSFPEQSPFAGLLPPEDVKVRQQVLARPGSELAQRTWARLADGSPLVTANRVGDGMLVLFHVTAGPDWSDLPYSGVFVDMLRRAIAAGRGETTPDPDGLYSPSLTLNGFGRLEQAGPLAAPLTASDLALATPSEENPPGLYEGPSGSLALNIGATEKPALIQDWPNGAELLGDAELTALKLGGLLLGLAAILLAIDLLVALWVAGKISVFKPKHRATVATAAIALISTIMSAPPIEAQTLQTDKAYDAALQMRLAYVETGNRQADNVTRAGLEGLSLILYSRSSVEPAEPHGIDPETDALDVYPVIFLSLPDGTQPLSETAVSRLNDYMRSGGAIFIDTRRGGTIGQDSFADLEGLLPGLDTPPLTPVPSEHVLTRSFYLLDGFPGRYDNRRLWIEATGAAERSERRGDGVSRLFVGDADYVAAWAIDDRRRPMFSVDGGDQQREMARRFGVNLVVYVLTGNYKEDQVHIPALLERIEGEQTGREDDQGIIP